MCPVALRFNCQCMGVQFMELRTLLEAGIASREVRPLPVTIFPRSSAKEAFRYLGKGMQPLLGLPSPFCYWQSCLNADPCNKVQPESQQFVV